MKILVINAGSSSLKYQLIDMENESLLAKGLCERIGIDGRLTHKPQNGKPVYEADVPFPTHKEAIEAVLEKLTSKEYGVVETMAEIGAVGHRVLHGGIEFTESCVVDDACEAAIKKCFPLGPLHNPANLMGIKACQAAMPGVPQVAVFDTSFGMSMTRPTASCPPAPARSWAKRARASSTAISATAPPFPRASTASASIPPWA